MAQSVQAHRQRTWAVTFRRAFIAGLLAVVPLVITYVVLRLVFNTIDGVLQPLFRASFDRSIPGAGIAALVLVIFVVGFLATNHAGHHLIQWIQRELFRIPVVGGVYSATDQLVESFSGTSATGFKHVVVLEYPRMGSWTIGFLTGLTKDWNGDPIALVYIPTAPTPQSGWVALMPVKDVFDTDLTIQEALRMVLSGGIVAPPQVNRRPLVLEGHAH
jgi:uncharacterized membrane protein